MNTDPRRPHWLEILMTRLDGKLVVASLMLAGYYFIIWKMLKADIPAANIDVIRDQMLVLGPAIGVVVGSLFRTTAAEERQSERNNETVKAALEAPATSQLALPAPAQVKEAVETGAREGVADGIERAADAPAPADSRTFAWERDNG